MAARAAEEQRPKSAPQEFDIASGEGRPFASDAGSFTTRSTTAYTGRDGSGWLLSLRDYLAGRTAELDRLFDYLEKSGDEAENNIGWTLQCASNEDVSKQLWALLATLLKGHDDSMRRFRNVPRHNGFRVWQVMTTSTKIRRKYDASFSKQ